MSACSEMLGFRKGDFGRISILDLKGSLVEHAHPEFHLKFRLSGDVKSLRVADRTVQFSNDNGIAVNRWEPHTSPVFEKDENGILLLLYINYEWLAAHCARNGSLPWFNASSFPFTNELQQTVKKLSSFVLKQKSSSVAQVEAGIRQLVDQSLIAMRDCESSGTSPFQNPDLDRRVKHSIDYMHRNIATRPRFSGVAKEVGISRSHFFTLFQEQMRITPSVYWNTIRMQTALKHVMATDKPLNELAHELGFSAPANFSRFFKKQTGVSPSQYRRTAATSAS